MVEDVSLVRFNLAASRNIDHNARGRGRHQATCPRQSFSYPHHVCMGSLPSLLVLF